MPEVTKNAEDPAKLLENIEKEYGAAPGELQREMAELAELAGDWRDHLPYEVAQSFYLNDAIRRRFAAHVDACPYCQRLLETLHPAEEAVAAFEDAAVAAISALPPVAEPRPWRLAASFALVAASLVGYVAYPAIFSGIGFDPLGRQAALELSEDSSALVDTGRLRIVTAAALGKWEQQDNIEAQFSAAHFFFLTGEERLAYERLRNALVTGGVDHIIADNWMEASIVDEGTATENLVEAVRELGTLRKALAINMGDPAMYVRVAGAHARLGQNGPALASIHAYLTSTRQDPEVVAQYETMINRLTEDLTSTRQDPEFGTQYEAMIKFLTKKQ